MVIGYGNRIKGISRSFLTDSNIVNHPEFQKSGKDYILEKESEKIFRKRSFIKENRCIAFTISHIFTSTIQSVKYVNLNKIFALPKYFTYYYYRGPPVT